MSAQVELIDHGDAAADEPAQTELPFTRSGRRSRRRPRAEKEQALVREILDYLRRWNVLCWRQNSGASSGMRPNGSRYFIRWIGIEGASDILGILPGGKFLAIEAKTSTGKLTSKQKRFLEAVNRAGGLAFVARSVRDVAAALEAVTSCNAMSLEQRDETLLAEVTQ